jgi:lysyl-tRNA synthetase class II
MRKLGLVVALAAVPAAAQDLPPALNDYPTEARAEYVFTCMAVNGQSRETLQRCSCSIDVIASILPYERYVDAETVLMMRQTGGERVGMFRSAPMANEMVQDLRRAQAEGEVRCF